MNLKRAGIYQIRHSESGKCYVGSSRDIHKRWLAHKSKLASGLHHSKRLQRSWLKHGRDAFEFSVVLLCAEGDLALYEQIVINARDAYEHGFNGLPIAYSAAGYTHTEEARAKLSLAHLGRVQTPEAVKSRTAWMKGRTMPLDAVAKMALTKTGKTVGPATEERKAAISAALKGKPKSASHVQAMREIRHSDETKAKISLARAGKKLQSPRDPEHTRKQQEAAARTRAAKAAAMGL